MFDTAPVNRRRFMETAASTAAVAAASSAFAQGDPASIGPNDTINMALIGCGARGRNQVMPSFMELPGVEFTAVCDVNSNNLEQRPAESWWLVGQRPTRTFENCSPTRASTR